MKKISFLINIVLLVLIGVLFYLHFKTSKEVAQTSVSDEQSQTELKKDRMKIAYVNLDSLEMHYTYFQDKKEELFKKQQSIQNELSSKQKAIQADIEKLQKNAATMTQSEGEAAEKKIIQQRQALQNRQQQLQNELAQQQQAFNQELHRRLDAFLEQYNSGKDYDYILSYSSDLSIILYKKQAYDITEEVIAGLNKAQIPVHK